MAKPEFGYAGPLARFGVKQQRTGRNVGGHVSIRDVTSSPCQRRQRDRRLASVLAAGESTSAVVDESVYRDGPFDGRAGTALAWRQGVRQLPGQQVNPCVVLATAALFFDTIERLPRPRLVYTQRRTLEQHSS